MSVNNDLCSDPKPGSTRSIRNGSCRSRISRYSIDSQPNDSRASVRANRGNSCEYLQERASKCSRWEDSSNNSSADEEVTNR